LPPVVLKNTFGSIHDVDLYDVMCSYYVGIFLRALKEGSLFDEKEQEIYSSIYVFEHEGLVPGYQIIAKYLKGIDTVVIQFMNTTNFSGYSWNLSQIIYHRIAKILRR